MKKITTIMLALMMVLFTQCKKENINDTDTNTDVKKVRIKCEIPMGGDKGEKSDFTNLLTDGSIKWSAEGIATVIVNSHVGFVRVAPAIDIFPFAFRK